MGFYFCEKCGVRVTDADVRAGLARDKQLNSIFCGKCSEGVLTVAYDAITKEELQKDLPNRPAVDRRSTSTRLPASKTAAGTTSRRLQFKATVSHSPGLWVGIACGALIAAALAAFLLLRSADGTRTARTDDPAIKDPPARSTPPAVTSVPLPPPVPPDTPAPPPPTPEPDDRALPPSNLPDQPPTVPPIEARPEAPLTPAEAAMAQAGPGHRAQLAFWLQHDPAKTQEAIDAVRTRGARLLGGAEWIVEPKGAALAFDKADGCVELPTAPLNGQANWTWAAWVWPENNGEIYSEGNPLSTFQLTITGSGAIQIRAWHLDRDGNWLESSSTAGAVPLKQWSHLTVTLSGGRASEGTYRFLVNGKEVSTAAGQAEFHRDTKFAALGDNIGARRGGKQEHAFFQGRLRDLRIFQRALKEDEVGILAQWDTAVPVTVTTQPASPIVREKEDDTETALPQTPRKVDLLPTINTAADAVQGAWLWTESGLRCYPASEARIALPYVPPQEYDLSLVFTEHSGQDAICLILSHAGRSFIAIAGGWANTVAGFETVDGKAGDANRTTNRRASFLEMGKRHALVARVRNAGVEVLLDGQVITSYKGDYKNISPAGWISLGPGREQHLGIGAWRSCVTFHAIEAIEIRGTGRVVRQNILRTRSGPAEGKALAPVYLSRLVEALDTDSPERARNLIGFARSEPALSAVTAALDQDLALTETVEQLTKAANEAFPLLKDGRSFSLRLSDGRTVALGAGAPSKVLGTKDGKIETEIVTPQGKIVEKLDAARVSLSCRGDLVLLARPDDPLGRFGQVAGRVAGLLRGSAAPTAVEIEKEVNAVAGLPGLGAGAERLKAWLAQARRERAAKAAFEQFRRPLNVTQQEQLRPGLKAFRDEYADTCFVQNAIEEIASLEQQWQPGLRAMYSAGDQTNFFKRPLQLRYESGLEFNWDTHALIPGCQADFLGVRVEGLLRIEKTGTYEFLLKADDELSVQLGSTSMTTKGCNQDTTFKANLSSGDQVLKIVYREHTGQAFWLLRWKPPGKQKFEAIPQDALYYRADAALQSLQQDRPVVLP